MLLMFSFVEVFVVRGGDMVCMHVCVCVCENAPSGVSLLGSVWSGGVGAGTHH